MISVLAAVAVSTPVGFAIRLMGTSEASSGGMTPESLLYVFVCPAMFDSVTN